MDVSTSEAQNTGGGNSDVVAGVNASKEEHSGHYCGCIECIQTHGNPIIAAAFRKSLGLAPATN